MVTRRWGQPNFESKVMTIDQACKIMEHYAVEQDLDDLAAIEHMVQNYSTLDPVVKQALKCFMDTAKELA